MKKMFVKIRSLFSVFSKKETGNEFDSTLIGIELKAANPVPTKDEIVDTDVDEKILQDFSGNKMRVAEYGEEEGEGGQPYHIGSVFSKGMKEIMLLAYQAHHDIMLRFRGYTRELQLRLDTAQTKLSMSEEDYKKDVEKTVNVIVKNKKEEINRGKEGSVSPSLQRKRGELKAKHKQEARKHRVISGVYGDDLPNENFYDKEIGYWSAMFSLGLLDLATNQILISAMFSAMADWIAWIVSFMITIVIMTLAHLSGAQLDISTKKSFKVLNAPKFWWTFGAGLSLSILFGFLRLITPDIDLITRFSGVLGVVLFGGSVVLAAYRHEHFEFFNTKRIEAKLQSERDDVDDKINKMEKPYLDAIKNLDDSVESHVDRWIREERSNMETEVLAIKKTLGDLEDYEAQWLSKIGIIYFKYATLYVDENIRSRRIAKLETNVELFKKPFPKISEIEKTLNLDVSSSNDNGGEVSTVGGEHSEDTAPQN